MRQTLLAGLALLAAYTLGTLRAPAHAENLEEMSTSGLLARLVTAQREQTSALKALSNAGELPRWQREQAEALRTMADQLGRSQREQTDALKSIARAVERCVK